MYVYSATGKKAATILMCVTFQFLKLLQWQISEYVFSKVTIRGFYKYFILHYTEQQECSGFLLTLKYDDSGFEIVLTT